MRVPHGTVLDNNLGPGRMTGPEALDTNHLNNQPFLLHDLCLEVLTVYGNELRLFPAKTTLPTYTINVAHLT